MFTKNTKRYVACMMLFFMLFTLVPVQAFAETDSHEGHVHTEAVASSDSVESGGESSDDTSTGDTGADGDSSQTGSDSEGEGDTQPGDNTANGGSQTETGDGATEGETGTENGDGTTEGNAGTETGEGNTEGNAGTENGDGATEGETGTENGGGNAEGEAGTENGDGTTEEETPEDEQPAEPATLEEVTAQADAILAAVLMLENPTADELQAAMAELADEESIKAAVAELDAQTIQAILEEMAALEEQAATLSEEDYEIFSEQYAVLADVKAALEEAAANLEQPEEEVTLAQVQDAAAALFTTYVGNANPTAEEIQTAVDAMDEDTVQAALAAIAEVEAQALLLNEEDAAAWAENSAAISAFKAALEAKEQPEELSEAYYEVQAAIDDILTRYLGTTEISEEDIQVAVEAMDWETALEAQWERYELADSDVFMQLTSFDAQTMEETNHGLRLFCYALDEKLKDNPYATSLLASGNFTMADGKVSVSYSGSSTADTGQKNSETGCTFAAWASGLWRGSTNTITLTNSSGVNGVITFDYRISGDCSACSLGKTSGSGTASYELENGAQITVTLTGKGGLSGGTEPQLVITNLKITPIVANPNITFEYDSSLGSITVGGTAVTTGTTQSVSKDDGVQLVATPNGSTFLGWIDGDGKILSTEATYTLKPTNDMTVKSVFTNSTSNAWFRIGSSYLFDDLNKADAHATAGGDKKIVLAHDGVLPFGDYKISAGNTLLIPFDDANTLYTTEPALQQAANLLGNTWNPNTEGPYRTLTLADGAKITVNGAISVSAKIYAAGGSKRGSGSPYGKYGYIVLQDGSNITIGNGGKLYTYGYINGNGSVTAEAGATVYETFQFEDFRGGDQTTQLVEGTQAQYGVFPINSYTVQNIMAPLTLEAGATEYSYAAMTVSRMAAGAAVAFISDGNAMFNLKSGSVTKKYSHADDRLVITSDGEIAINEINMSVATYNINSEKYELPINGNMTVNINSGSITLNQDVVLFPGAKIEIAENATCYLGENSIYIYDLDEWEYVNGESKYGFVAPQNVKMYPTYYVPERQYTRSEKDLEDASMLIKGEVDSSSGSVYTTESGAAIRGEEGAVANIKTAGEITPTYQMVQAGDPANSTFVSIPITPAKLMNGNGSYTETAILNEDGTYTARDGLYYYVNSFWHAPGCDGEAKETITKEPTCTETGLKTEACACGIISSEGVVVEATGHKSVTEPAKAATCTESGLTEGKHCSECGLVITAQKEIAALGHDHQVAVENKATCTATGDVQYKCSRCTNTKTESLPVDADNHPETSLETVTGTPATCTETGLTDGVYCNACETWVTEQEVIPATGHPDASLETVTGTPATCTEAGKTDGVYCNACNTWVTAQEDIEKLGHEEVTVEGYPATCTENGLTNGVQCSVCETWIEEQEVIYAAGAHTSGEPQEENRTEPSCDTAGSYDLVVRCTVCNEVLNSATNTIPALGHKDGEVKEENRVEATCSQEGSYDEVVYCAVCKEEISRTTKTIPTTDHTPANTVVENNVAADCDSEGSYDEVVYCTVCKAELSRKTITVDALGHTAEEIPAVAPTCTETGLTSGVKCSVCDEILMEQEVVSALGHTEGEAVVENNVAADCDTAGSYDSVVYCEVCEEELSRNTITVDALGHTEETLEAKEATCTETGLTEGKKCTVCGKITVEQEVVSALGHTEGEAVVENNVAADCVNEGSYDNVVYCTVCKAELSRETITVDALGHTEGEAVVENNVAADCVNEGSYDNVVYCTVCKAELSRETITVDALGHTEGEAVVENNVAADCVNEGSYDNVVYCTVCKAELSRETITVDALGHTEKVIPAVEPTCTETGLTEGKVCTVCDETLVEQEVVNALGHTDGEAVTENEVKADCTNAGSYDTVVYCTVCKAELSRETITVDALGHTEEVIPAVEPTCNETGLTEGKKCTVCKEITVAQEVVDALGHNWNDGEITQKPNCTSSGVKTFTCGRCGATKTETVAALGHTEEIIPAVAPDCENTGLTEGKKCSVCHLTLTEPEEVSALGHSEGEAVIENEVKADCTTAGSYDTVVKCTVCTKELSRTTTTVPALGHTDAEAVVENNVDATCTEAGSYDSVVYCSVCGKEVSRTTVTVEATGHTEGDAATCTTAQTCTVCGTELKAALGHDHVGVETTKATCTEEGLMTYTCSRCPDSYTETIKALGHRWAYEPAIEATCTEDGLSSVAFCRRCDVEEEAKVIPALGHKWDDGVVLEKATCSKEGKIKYTCTRNDCGVTDEKPIEKLPHTEVTVPAVGSSCTATGLTEGVQCSVCEEWIVEQEEVAVLGHNEVTIEGKAATCTETGLTEGKYCDRCGEVLVEQTVIDVLGHDMVTDEAKAPTCTASGLTEGSHCSRCDYTEAQETVDALGHSYQYEVTTAPTCAGTGVQKVTCARCDYEKYEAVDALGHTKEEIPAVEATCTKTGLTAGVKCTVCGDILVKQEITPALGHTEGEAVIENEVAADCTTEGSYDTVVYCSVCGDELSRKTTTVDALGHTEGETVVENEVAADCTNNGSYDNVVYCTVCGDELSRETVTVDALGHTEGEAVIENEVAADCTTEGSYDTVIYCTVCKAEVSRETTTVDALGHTEGEAVVENSVAADCTNKGSYDTVVYCSVCGKELSRETTTVDALGHTEGEAAIENSVAADCTTEGSYDTVVYCSVCGEELSRETTTVDALGHTEGEAVIENEKDVTCTVDGSYDTVVYCTVCKAEVSRETTTITAKGHTEVIDEAKAPTCTETGLTEGKHCSVCDTVLVAQKVVKAKGHTEVIDSSVAATCTEPGKGYGSHCDVCGEIIREQAVIPAKGHTEVAIAAQNPTCTETGLTAGVKCSVCGEILKAQEVVDALGHTEEILGAVEATCTKTGLTAGVKCSVCGEVLTAQETVPALGHTEEEIPAVEATCTETGLKAGVKCSVCGVTLVTQVVVPAKGHTTVTDAAQAPTCTETGLTAGSHCDVCGETLKAQEVIPAKGHTEVIDKAVAATCTETGLTEGKHCSVCGVVLVEQTVTEAAGHTEEEIPAVEATCTKAGLTSGVKCSVCGEILKAQETVAALGHTEVIDEAQAPTCTEMGKTEGKHCSVCGTVLVAQKNVASLGHKEVIDEAKAPTCTETGLTAGKHCSVCEEVLVAQTVVDALGHTEVIDKAVDATCKAPGLTEGSHCEVCGEVLVAQEEVAQLEHKWNTGRVTTEPTCTEEGVRTFTCTVCRTEKEEPEPEKGHDLVHFEAKLPTYTEDGWDAYDQCQREGCDYSTRVVIPALGEARVETYDEFVEQLEVLEGLADTYVKKVSPGKDPAMLVIKYIRTGVDRYNSGSWNIMAGYEDADFAKYVSDYEAAYNAELEEGQPMMAVTGLKNIDNFTLPNGDYTDIGHMFGTMDISYTNNNSVDHADVAGFFGDTVDLLSAADRHGVDGTLEEMVEDITENYLCKDLINEDDKFGQTDMYGDLDGFYVMETLNSGEYENGTLTNIITNYMTESLTDEQRADFYLKNRLNGVTLRTDVRDAVYNAYIANGVIATLEGTREFTSDNLDELRKATCYTVADYLTRLAGDWVEVTENPYLNVFQSTSSTLAPGITQVINYATTADDQTMVYYIATGDITRDDVNVYANYHNNDPGAGWEMQRVLDQANAAQNKYGNPESEQYIENYNVIASINGDGYNMYTGEPGGLLVMDGHEWHACDGNGFFAILADGTAKIGTKAEYEALKAEDKVKEAIGAFGTTLVKDGEINITATSDYYTDRAGRTAVGITKTGKVVFLVIDGRQGEFSCGASAIEIAQIMLDAGCYQAVNLDGGGSTTYVARPEGESELRVVNSPSDGAARSVATSLLMVSTAASSTAFDHAVLDSRYAYLTVDSSTDFTAVAVSATGNVVELPEGTVWAVSDESIGTITEDGVFTAKANGDVTVNLLLDGEVVGSKVLHVVTPDNVYFEKDAINAIYGHPVSIPVRAVYEGKEVAINENDVELSLGNAAAGIIEGFSFTADEASGLKKATVIAALTSDPSITASMTVALYSEDEASFDFDNATGGDRQLAWNREVSNATEDNKNVYRSIDPAEDMVTSYTFAIDMSKIDIPPQLADLTYMLPGADMENASAWNFLLQLAERISVLSTVTPVLKFDPNFDVDYSELSILNEYFIRNSEVYDEATNTLTLNLSWKDQTEPIDADTANPLCIVSGIKLTPKDGTWDNKTQISPVNSGSIGYEIYLRTNALYTFASKPENQEIYGLKEFINPNDPSEKGGKFGSVYKEFEDQYTLINAAKDGWVIEDGGFAYYKDGNKYTGICEVDGLYYDFGQNGVNIGKKPYTGVMTDAAGNEYYLDDGLMHKGWLIANETYVRYYNPETGIREKLTADETPSTCIIDGHCIYTTESGAVKRVDYDDAGGHEYVEQPDGTKVCSVCGWKCIEMSDVNIALSVYECTYTGSAMKPYTKAVTDDGYVLTKPGTADYPDYGPIYENNVEVGTASVTLRAARYGKYQNINTWRGNVAGEVTVTYEIRPDLPTNVVMEQNDGKVVMSWTAAKAPGVTYVIYKSVDGKNWTEAARTTATTFEMAKTEAAGYMFRIGTCKEVDGKNYESLSFTPSVALEFSVVAGHNDDGKPTLKWTVIENAVSYEVYRSTAADGDYIKMFTTEDTTYTNTSAVVGTTYYYKVKVIMTDGEEVYSEVVANSCIIPSIVFDITTGHNNAGKPTLKWADIEGAAYYEVYRSSEADGDYEKMFTTKGITYTNTSATAGRTYYYKVKVSLTNGEEVYSEVVVNSCIIPDVVFDITAGNNNAGKPTLKWAAIENAVSYEVYRSTATDGEYVKMFTTKGTTFTNTSAVAGRTYYYKVKVSLTNGEEVYSEVVVNSCIIPDVVFDITAGNNDAGKPTLKWADIEGAASYEVYRSSEADGEYVKMFTTKGTTFTNTSAVAGRTYYYKVKVSLTNGEEVYSEVVVNSCIIPDVVFDITAGNNNEGKPTLKWADIEGAASYEVYRSTAADGEYVKMFTTKGTTFTNTSAAAGRTYYYKVKVILTNGEEVYSDIVTNTCL